MRTACLALLACLFISSQSVASDAIDRLDRSYRYGEALVSLDHDPSVVAVLLHAVEDEFALVTALADDVGDLERPTEDDRHSYRRLWLLHPADGVSGPRLLALLDALDDDPRTEFASPVFRYGKSLLVPKPELLVTFDDNEDARRRSLEREFSLESPHTIRGLRTTFHYDIPVRPRDMFRWTQRLGARAGIASAEPNFILQLERSATPNDPSFANQWALQNTGQTGGTIGADMKATAAWDTSTGSSSIVIAIIDEGVDMDHEDLAANIVGGYDATDQAPPEGVPGNATSDNGHGTSCAGIAAAVGNNNLGVAGVSWSSGILAVRIAYGDFVTEIAWIADAITWSADNGADVLSNSWGGGPPSTTEQNAIIYAKTSGRGGLGCPVLFASGNDNAGVSYPAAYPETIAVGASSPCDERKNPASCDGETWWGSNFGPELTLVAPGVLIETTDIMGAGGYSAGNYVTNFNGTSSACPNAAGGTALLLSVAPGLTAAQVQTYLEQSCDDQVGPPAEDTVGFDDYMGWGRLNLETLMTLAGAPSMPENLSCTDVSGDASLSWTNPQTYDSIVISRDGVDIAAISGTATSYIDIAPAIGTHVYGVRGVVAGLDGAAATCTLFISGGATDLVFQPDDADGSVDGGQGLIDALIANGRTAIAVNDLSIVLDLNDFDRIWVNLGVYPNNHVLTAAEGSLLETYLTDNTGGGALYLEGADTWFFDSATSVHPYFEIDGLADGPSVGDLVTATGTGTAICDLTGIDLNYSGENAWMDRLGPLAAAWTIQSNSSPIYDIAIYNETTDYRTIGASHEFAGFVDGTDTRADLMAAYLDCLGANTVPTAVTGLSCNESGNDVLLAWTNGDVYSTIEIRRNGGVLATISGTDTSYVDAAPPGGTHNYEVIGYDLSTPSPATACSVDVTPDTPTGLSCTVTPTTVDLAWANPESYGDVEVFRDGVSIALLAGSATSYSDASPLSGVHTYEVIGSIGLLASAAASCAPDYVEPPSIVSQPNGATECPGTAVTFSVAATGDSLSYTWRKDSNPIGGANSASYTITSITAGDAGSYDCVVSNSAGSETSNGATLTVLTAPVITSHPSNVTDCPGAAIGFAVAASGDGLSYQWRKDGSPIAGAVGSSYNLASISAGDAGGYDCVVSGTCGSATSNLATLTVLTAPSITAQPSGQTECPGTAIALSVGATGDGLSYQWRLDGVSISGATAATYNIASLAAGDVGAYDCVVSGTCGSATSNSATVAMLAAPAITSQPVDHTECPATAVVFTLTAIGDGLSYQWRKNGVAISGATSTNYAIGAVASGDAGDYDCVVTGTCGIATSNLVTLEVLTTPSITAQPAGQTECPGTAILLSVSATGDGLGYQWRLDGTPISGATAATYDIASLAAGDVGSYDCVITGTCGSISSNIAVVAMLAAPAITAQPIDQTECSGASIAFSVSATGDGLAYQWRKNGAPISGATNASYSIGAVATGDAGGYDCVITGTCGTTTSNSANLTVLSAPSVTGQPGSATECPGTAVTFTISATGDGVTFQWRKNGAPIGGATGSSYLIGAVAAGDAGNYDCVVTGTCGTATSTAATLTVLPTPSIVSQPSNTSACPGATTSFAVVASGSGLSYQWRKDGVGLPGATGSSYTVVAVTPSDAGAYDCIVTGTCDLVTSNAATLTVFDPPVVASDPTDLTTCPGDPATFAVTASGTAIGYQWRKNGVDIPGANASSYAIASTDASDVGSYDCVVSGTCGDATSDSALLSVLAVPTVDTSPASQVAAVGDAITFSVAASGATPLSYQWYFDGAAIGGATSSTLNLAAVTSGDAGVYHVEVTNGCDTAVSNTATLTIGDIPAVTDLTCCPTDDVVTLCWTNNTAYDAITITRDGTTIATLPGDDACYADSGVAAGSHDYSVVGSVLTDNSAPSTCTTSVLANLGGLGCTILNPTFATPDVELTWTNPGGYDAIEVRRDGIAVATLVGTAIDFVDIGVAIGAHTYEVIGSAAGVTCPSTTTGASCGVDVLGGIAFRRGDANDDGTINVADVVFTLAWIFTGGADPNCFDAADVNDDGVLDLADAIYELSFIFTEGAAPPPPYDTLGTDPTDDSLGCDSYSG